MVFNGFDLGVKDKNGRSICVGDKVILCKNTGRVIYSPSSFCFGIQYEDDFDELMIVNPKHIEVINE